MFPESLVAFAGNPKCCTQPLMKAVAQLVEVASVMGKASYQRDDLQMTESK